MLDDSEQRTSGSTFRYDDSASYGGGGGSSDPTKWDYDNDDWAIDDCKGLSQSPVDIIPDYIALGRKGSSSVSDFISYTPLSGLSLKNTGYGVQVDGEFGTFTMESEVYQVTGERLLLVP